MFTLTPDGLGLLLQAPAVTILLVCGSAALGIAAIAGGLAGWLSIPLNRLQRGILVAAGGLLVAPLPWADLAGLGLMAVVPFLQSVQRSHPRAQNGSS
jgi:TRAP-type uncharacterized transport system fused permease subunit